MSEFVPVRMVCASLESCPVYPLAGAYTLRGYTQGDRDEWVRIQQISDTHQGINTSTFDASFGSDDATIAQRMLFLCAPDGTPVGTASAWMGDDGEWEDYGRVHWVAILPEEQGKGLAKPLMSAVCAKLYELGHREAYLTTAAVRVPAISLYSRFGFAPDIRTEGDRSVWEGIRASMPPGRELP